MDQPLYSGTYFHPLHNLKGFASTRPPLLVFLICLLVFAITAASLAYVVNRTQLKDPGVNVDWNEVLSHFSHLSMCIHNTDGSSSKLIDTNDPSGVLEPTDDFSLNGARMSTNNDSVSLLVKLRFGRELHSLPTNMTNIAGYVCKRTLGLTEVTNFDPVGISLDLNSERTLRCEKKSCTSEIVVCITFHGLPVSQHTSKMKTCSSSAGNISSFNSLVFTVAECDYPMNTKKTKKCDGILLPFFYESNPEWSLFLSEHERALINLHLLYTSYFLLVMAMTIVCYAIVRGRSKPKGNTCERLLIDT